MSMATLSDRLRNGVSRLGDAISTGMDRASVREWTRAYDREVMRQSDIYRTWIEEEEPRLISGLKQALEDDLKELTEEGELTNI